MNIRVIDILEEHKIDAFIWTLKDNIQHEVRLWELDSLEKGFRVERKVERKIMATRKSTNHDCKDGNVFSASYPQPTIFTPQQLDEKISKGICYIHDIKYTKGDKGTDKKLFYIGCEEEEENEQETSKEEDIHQEPTLEEE